MRRLLSILMFCQVISACTTEKAKEPLLPAEQENQIFQMATSYFKALPELPWQAFTPTDQYRIQLGKKLFYDKRLSKNQSQNCASCHIMEKFGMDNLRVSPGDGGAFGIRNVPTILNASLQYAQFWDARAGSVEEQAGGPIFGMKEMGMKDTLELIQRIEGDSSYAELFALAFPGEDTLISLETLTRALGAFERTLTTPSRFDAYLKGDKYALSIPEKKGLKSFIEQGCIPCHSGVLLGGNMAQKFSLFGYYWDYTNSVHLDKGRYQETLDPSDKFVFKVPGLRNVAETAPYFHDGSVESLEESIRIMSLAELNLDMQEEDVKAIVAFLKTLSGTIPAHAIEGTPFPFSDK